ncbi:membrane lipoprotein lipid attachment site-containing protein [Carnobacterium funditum]|uniref:membrane lipoprotein lipid attachment site-containing protein n=1 Tax=Carnobacterium funditum TaxID=2752 RepID=UPI00054F0699|nr:membrane lipoprotein lipid attachment site-containing protein [Carnobacterium funditum]
MKKMSFLLVLAFILSGCNFINSNDANKNSSSTESQSQTRSDIRLLSDGNEVQKKPQKEKELLTFVPQLDEINQGLTTENDRALSDMQKFVKENQDMGFENDVTIVYSGQTFGESPNLAGVFLIINRTEDPLENMQFTYTFGGVDKILIFDQKPFHLTTERFGVLQPNTVMPLYFVVKPENEKELKEIGNEQVIEKVESFNYDIANKNANQTISEDKESSTNGLTFKLPKQNSDKGQTVENNPIMSKLKKIVDETENLGFENDVTVLHSKLSEKNENDTAAYFFVINRTPIGMKDIRFNFNYGDAEGNMVWENAPYYMSSEVFGISEPMTVIPFTLTVPKEKEDLFFSITEGNVKTRIDNFNYNEAK